MEKGPSIAWAGYVGEISVIVVARDGGLFASRVDDGGRRELRGEERRDVLQAVAADPGAPSTLREIIRTQDSRPAPLIRPERSAAT